MAALLVAACGDAATMTAPTDAGTDGLSLPAWLAGARIQTSGDDAEMDCRTKICRHNENTDLIRWHDAVWLVHRTARSQTLGDDSSLLLFRSVDDGATLVPVARIPALTGRDIRDPHFYVTPDDVLHVKALTRLPMNTLRDADVDTVAVETHRMGDDATWSSPTAIGPHGWSFWRIKQGPDHLYYTAAYHDGDSQVTLFSSRDGLQWTQGADVYTVAADTPLETELVFMPSGRLLALVRMDGTTQQLLAQSGPLRTKVCWAEAPAYASFDCRGELDGARLDGPLAFFAGSRLFVVAREHILDGSDRKRTALYELTGTLDGGPIDFELWGEFPSAGDTAYAGAAPVAGGAKFLVSWYSGDLAADDAWTLGMFDRTDIWVATLDPAQVR